MSSSHRRNRQSVAAAIAFALAGAVSHAADITWIGGNADWINNGSTANWNPADEPDSDDTAIFNTPNAVNLGSSHAAAGTGEIQNLTLSGGIDLSLNGFAMTVNGTVSASGAGTTLIVPDHSVLTADRIQLSSSAVINMSGGIINVIEESGNGLFNIASLLSGNGTINLQDSATASGTAFLVLSGGTITAGSTTPLDILSSAAATLTLSVSSANGRVDLDNVSGVINISRNDSLRILGSAHTTADPYSGTLNMGEGSTLFMSNAWFMDFGTVNVNTAAALLGTAGNAAHIAGGTFTMDGGNIDLDPVDSLQFDAPFTMNSGTMSNSGLVIFGANATIGAGANFTMTSSVSSLSLLAGVTVNVNPANFNADGSGTSSNVITLGSGAILNLNLGVGGDTGLTGTVNLNGGTLNMTTNTNTWLINGDVVVGAGTGLSTLTGPTLTVSGASMNIGAGSTLTINGSKVFSTNSTYSGAGLLLLNGNTTVSANTTIATTLFNWDGDIQGDTFNINSSVNFTFNAASLVDPMNDNVVLGGDNATLTVNGTGSWTMNRQFIANSTGLGIAHIGGTARMLLSGDAAVMQVNGQTFADALITFGANSVVNINVGSLRLLGGDFVSQFNLINGSTINGPASLTTPTSRVLQGFGTINASLNFDGTGSLLASGGTLTVGGTIVDMGTIGTADTTGTLNVVNAWNTSVADNVQLKGGEMTGGTVTVANAGGIKGFGLVSSRIFNNNIIQANVNGETLLFQTPLNNNDWDGAANNGFLTALNGGILALRDTGSFGFTGTVSISNGSTVSINSFTLNLSVGSTLAFNAGGGTYSSTMSVPISGTVLVNGPGILDITINQFLIFESTAVVTLNNNLTLKSNNANIHAGATFSGTGALIIPDGSFLVTDPDTNINALMIMRGSYIPGGFNVVGRTDLKDYQQTATGQFFPEFTGTNLNQFDRLVVSGAAQINGHLDIDLDSGFVPALGDQFAIITATGGVSGSFATVDQPLPVGLLNLVFTQTINPFNVTLTVSNAYYEVQNGLYNNNFTGSGYELWKTTVGTATLDGNSSYTGTTRIFAGILSLASANALDTSGPILFAGGTLQFTASNTTDYSSRFSNTAGQNFKLDTNGQLVTLANPLSSTGGTLTKLGNGTLRLLGANVYGDTLISGGVLELGNGGANGSLGSGSVTNNGTLRINRSGLISIPNAVVGSGGLEHTGTGTTTLNGPYTATGALKVLAGTLVFAHTLAPRQTPAIVVDALSLTISANTSLDLKNHDMIVRGGNYNSIEALVASAFTLNQNWSGKGLTSSDAASFLAPTTLGVAVAQDVGFVNFDGLVVNPTDVLVKYTYFGDADMNGIVNDDDYTLLQLGYGIASVGWEFGDFNRDGLVNDDDYTFIQIGYGSSPILGSIPQVSAISTNAVPEPGSLALLGLGVSLLVRRSNSPRRIAPFR